MTNFSNEQLSKLLLHTANINLILLDALLQSSQPEIGNSVGAGKIETDENPENLFGELDLTDSNKPERVFESQFILKEHYNSGISHREQALSLLCGRWMANKNRGGVEISRAGEHFVLTYLKRNGYPSDERYILVWLDGDILYYGNEDRITVLALNMESDTLMISPGVDYTRVPDVERV